MMSASSLQSVFPLSLSGGSRVIVAGEFNSSTVDCSLLNSSLPVVQSLNSSLSIYNVPPPATRACHRTILTQFRTDDIHELRLGQRCAGLRVGRREQQRVAHWMRLRQHDGNLGCDSR
jgi:hypothetical protein